MSMQTSDANRSFLPDDIGPLIIRPVEQASVAVMVSSAPSITKTSHRHRVPILAEDPSAAWVPEAGEIPESKATLDEDITDFYKLAGLTVVSRELANDTDPGAVEMVGRGLGRDIARELDKAFFGTNTGNSAVQPRGLKDITPNVIADIGAWANVDPFIEAIYAAESEGALLTSFVAHPDDALALAQLKEADDSNRNLLQPDPTQPTRRLLAGVPLLTSPAVTPGEIWGIPRDRVIIPIREDVTVDVDHSVYFTSDRVAVKATLRAGTLFPHPLAVQRVQLAAA